MCQRVRCSSCGKPSFVGCGRHVEQVLGDVPRDERCKCGECEDTESTGGETRERSVIERLFGL